MKGNVSFYQVNLVSRITGEGGGRSFEGRGGLVLIKSERVWRGDIVLIVSAMRVLDCISILDFISVLDCIILLDYISILDCAWILDCISILSSREASSPLPSWRVWVSVMKYGAFLGRTRSIKAAGNLLAGSFSR